MQVLIDKKNRILIYLLIFILLSSYNNSKYKFLNNFDLFRISSIQIEGNSLLLKKEIIQLIGNIFEQNIFFLKKSEIDEKLKSVSIIHSFDIKKKYPDTIIINIYEEKPLGILIEKDKHIITQENNIISYNLDIDKSNLPLIYGKEAEIFFLEFYNLLKKYDFPLNKISSFHFFQIGRWDLKLKNEKIIKLPYENIERSIIQTITYLNEEKLKEYNIIDLRIDGKIIVQ
ncbi:MAG: hypothetical protein CBC24_01220 [Candidatus Pelagibacter sp. TMED64]|nr:hypothetical protein [Candidatus Pelagibacter sp.]OUU67303.1 MAG: hypothetical protein CBC24_01220 [Candidatus Pelagibacter sp. TMED64]